MALGLLIVAGQPAGRAAQQITGPAASFGFPIGAGGEQARYASGWPLGEESVAAHRRAVTLSARS
jgi:hypothetical protein